MESRTRPCLQHQIKRCAAPCVGRISKTDYDVLVKEARAFLAGRSRDVQQRLTKRMTAASDALEFETAAAYRDRIKALAHIQTRQGINMPTLGDADVVAIHEDAGKRTVAARLDVVAIQHADESFDRVTVEELTSGDSWICASRP